MTACEVKGVARSDEPADNYVNFIIVASFNSFFRGF